jgi:16S rRNA (guanine527-N7)-methyltransferase
MNETEPSQSAIESSKNLQQAIEQLGLDIDMAAMAQMQKYCEMLWDRNQVLNLTRHTDFDTFARRDVLDSWHLSRLIEPNTEVLDIGSGGGVPGLLLAIMRPDLQITVCDSVGKKATVLDEFARDLGLEIETYHCRAEDLVEDFRFDYCVARAVGSLSRICTWLDRNWINVGRLLAVKGPRFQAEIEEAQSKGLLDKLDVQVAARYPMPGTESESIILNVCLKSLSEKNN